MKTLEEAIIHAKEVAKETYIEAMLCHANPDDGKLDSCIECAQEHEQLAAWLTELKECREKDNALTVNVAQLVEGMKEMNASYVRLAMDYVDVFAVTEKEDAEHLANAWEEYRGSEE